MINVAVHASQYPAETRRELLDGLRRKQFPHRFHYETPRQAELWRQVHAAYSPWVIDPACPATYEQAFAAIAEKVDAGSELSVLSIGCGTGAKDAMFLGCLAHERDRFTRYFPVDCSLPLVLEAAGTIHDATDAESHPLLLDFGSPLSCVDVFAAMPETNRIFLFLGVLPNFEPEILDRMSTILKPRDALVLSANLAPGPDYAAGVEKVLAGYDNALTRAWLLQGLLDLGLGRDDGAIHFSVEHLPGPDLRRITAHYVFRARCELTLFGETISFSAGDQLRLFFSYRYDPARLRAQLEGRNLHIAGAWTTPAGDEGIFLCRKR